MRYHNITKDDMLNGEGLRSVLWLAGCSHACKGCHNPVTWSLQGGLAFDEDAKAELFASLHHDYIDGVTLSGGDPLHPENRKDVHDLVKELKEKFPKKTIWLYTGYEYAEIVDLDLLAYIDVVVDGKFIEEQLSPNTHWVGSSNQKVIDVQASRALKQIVLYKE
ncbi:anaerobic ribonucleoside-triphosphate reductase activating protein [Breznakia sp. PF5-3]|uniref:anaerobic ribonucleoside-triphosphate reductase activating protein n=1 Tax=unclassified Breznakia TaxID=2623764 RepID=UPI0024054DE7|nr:MULTISPECIES: anaerobic ribonucleoside-triphosphate reductase activating protein [unclassified Breznakia]MDL2276614.1 anaerobic ribonucleoside-triphosphate reductase activating protein [Breznakia sp. OttesenSCG-928-G09]MDF9824658.1 anaerobic ribonucleoside-triphosphate reductase activating protein [Breznakia sp. PM6-1]MDF9835643.1 anaerobic ribonucleoside-triphosphate reductase activating protein [Breznakia sp. PF5-3]MDF9837692.1 anaerobic ribonucleoside-triphosphate reductase activating pro